MTLTRSYGWEEGARLCSRAQARPPCFVKASTTGASHGLNKTTSKGESTALNVMVPSESAGLPHFRISVESSSSIRFRTRSGPRCPFLFCSVPSGVTSLALFIVCLEQDAWNTYLTVAPPAYQHNTNTGQPTSHPTQAHPPVKTKRRTSPPAQQQRLRFASLYRRHTLYTKMYRPSASTSAWQHSCVTNYRINSKFKQCFAQGSKMQTARCIPSVWTTACT